MKKLIFSSLLSIFFCLPLWANDKAVDVDYLSLAALLINDGNIARAESILSEVNQQDKNLDKPRFYLLKGLVALKQEQFDAAQGSFEASILAGQEDLMIHLYLAQAQFGLKQYSAALNAINQAREVGESRPAVQSMKAECYWQMKDYDQAWMVLDSSSVKFPGEQRFVRQKIKYLLELELYQDALSQAQDYLHSPAATAKDYLSLGRSLRLNKQLQEASLLLEQALLKFPGNVQLITELAHVYLDKGNRLNASDLFAQAAMIEPRLSSEAAELYRRANRLYRSLDINAGIVEQKTKLKQRLAISLELENYEMAAGMGGGLYRHGLLKDQDVRYAYAYALYRTGDFRQSVVQLSKLSRPDLFRKSTELRKAMDACQNNKWRCF